MRYCAADQILPLTKDGWSHANERQVHMSVNAKKFVARRLLDKVLER